MATIKTRSTSSQIKVGLEAYAHVCANAYRPPKGIH